MQRLRFGGFCTLAVFGIGSTIHFLGSRVGAPTLLSQPSGLSYLWMAAFGTVVRSTGRGRSGMSNGGQRSYAEMSSVTERPMSTWRHSVGRSSGFGSM